MSTSSDTVWIQSRGSYDGTLVVSATEHHSAFKGPVSEALHTTLRSVSYTQDSCCAANLGEALWGTGAPCDVIKG